MNRKPAPGNVRRVGSVGKSNNIRSTSRGKNDEIIATESFSEDLLAMLFHRNPEIESFQSQPETFKWVDDKGRARKYTPDFIVYFTDGRVAIYEVTVQERRDTRLNIREREAAAIQICAERGWTYHVITEADRPSETEIANLIALFRFRVKCYLNVSVENWVQNNLVAGAMYHIGPTRKKLEFATGLSTGEINAAICHMIWHCRLEIDANQLLFDYGVPARGVRIIRPAEE